MNLKPVLGRITQTNVINTNGTITPTYVVSFMVGEHGPFTTQIPAEQFGAAAVKAAMEKVATEISQISPGA
jgi:hypothetical protein